MDLVPKYIVDIVQSLSQFGTPDYSELQQVHALLQTVPFRVNAIVMDRLMQNITISVSFYHGGQWMGVSKNLSVYDAGEWFKVFSEVFSDTYAMWVDKGQPREPYTTAGTVWHNE